MFAADFEDEFWLAEKLNIEGENIEAAGSGADFFGDFFLDGEDDEFGWMGFRF